MKICKEKKLFTLRFCIKYTLKTTLLVLNVVVCERFMHLYMRVHKLQKNLEKIQLIFYGISYTSYRYGCYNIVFYLLVDILLVEWILRWRIEVKIIFFFVRSFPLYLRLPIIYFRIHLFFGSFRIRNVLN